MKKINLRFKKSLAAIGTVLLVFFTSQIGICQFSLGATVSQLSEQTAPGSGFCPGPPVNTMDCDCPAGSVVVGYEGEIGNSYGGQVMSQYSLLCKELMPNGTLGAMTTVTCSNGSLSGTTAVGPLLSGGNNALVGAQQWIGCAMDRLQGYEKSIVDIAAGTSNATSTAITAIGGISGNDFPTQYVPDGNVIVGMSTFIDENPPNGFNVFGITVGTAWRYAEVLNAPAADLNHPDAGVTSNFTVACGSALTNYYDNGGEGCDGVGSYQVNDPGSVAIICPDVMGQPITLEFLEVDIEIRTTAPCWDFLNIYDGMGTGGTQLFSGCGEEGFQSCAVNPGDGGDGGGVEAGPNDIHGSNDPNPFNNLWTSTDASGCLTVEFTSDASVDEGGWIATLGCEAIAAPPSGCGIVCPDDIAVPCEGGSNPAVTGTATAGADCTVDFTDEVIGCSITRTWTATAPSGEITTCVQSITLIDDSAPAIVCPPSQSLTCFETIPEPVTTAADFIAAGGTISDNCTGDLADFSIFSQDSNNGGDNCPANATVVTR
ncbi:MAG: hypothetical protein AB8F74_15755, partial [Saprospiraceae bacterium]